MLTDTATLDVSYVVYAICFLIIPIRLCATYLRNRRWRTDDCWMLLALLVLIVWAAITPLVLKNGTNNIKNPSALSADEVHPREFGSKMVLILRSVCVTISGGRRS
jgi:hypothetical protein